MPPFASRLGLGRIPRSGPRFFSSTSQAASRLKINADRLNNTIHDTCQWGAAHPYGSAPTETGMARLALTDDDARVRRWFADEVRNIGCDVAVDAMGNQFARRRGRTAAAMTAMGSHLDTQPRGGRYDGILGVIAGLEVLRTLHENGYETKFDVGAVNWTNEEGARFPKSMISSGVWAGDIPIDNAHALADIFDSSATVKSELRRHGFLGDIPCTYGPEGYPLGAHFELHIEQGPILQDAGRRIGVVQGAQAYRWFTFTVTGRDAHTGTTPLGARKDPLLAASRMVVAAHEAAKAVGGLASTGVLKMPTNSSTNTIASTVSFTLDIRHPEDEIVARMQDTILATFEGIAGMDGRGVELAWTLDTDSPATKFHPDCIGAVEKAADGLVGRDGWLHITSGAGHDSVYTSRRCPTTMIFVPCKDGVSHHPEEYCSPEDCAMGTQALLDAVLEYDESRSS